MSVNLAMAKDTKAKLVKDAPTKIFHPSARRVELKLPVRLIQFLTTKRNPKELREQLRNETKS